MSGPIRFVILTGLSGAGKSYAIKCFEDMGYFCVDNLPAPLIPTFAELCTESTRKIHRIALGIDVREGEYLRDFVQILEKLRATGHPTEILFLEAADEVLIQRYQETRRRHPLAGGGTIRDGIVRERSELADLREMADRVVDTSRLTVHQLKDLLGEHYGLEAERPLLQVTVVSFGYKFGIPFDADLVFDARFLPNPFFVPGLKALDGRHEAVRGFLGQSAQVKEFLARLESFLDYLLAGYRNEGKSYLTVAVGCTGGRHRSVAVVEELRHYLERQGVNPVVAHRDVDRE
ncbi:MAG: RNase adapter RapZ [Candidatus Rokubacteria bacterium]|nr:RNase adapter RapZ [Candidatus Rokubacteria bacterium]